MKKIIFLLSASLVILSCAQSNLKDGTPGQTVPKTEVSTEEKVITGAKATNNLLGLTEAEKILGETAQLNDSLTSQSTDVLVYQCTYKAKAEDAKSKKTGALYFLLEQYDEVSLAKKKYSTIKKANEEHEGIKVLNDLGDEAYFHSDNQNFYFVMVRKGKKVFNMKVNKITSTTSLEAFNGVAKQITEAL